MEQATIEVQPLSDSACEKILAENGESDETTEVVETTETIQAGSMDAFKELLKQNWLPWALAGGFLVLWATKDKRRN